jgi:acylphosphatase
VTDESRVFRVFGRVQGVGFRQWALRAAERLKLSGTVRNLRDGSVEVRVRGAHAAIRELESGLNRGPVAAKVERVESAEVSAADVIAEGFRVVP